MKEITVLTFGDPDASVRDSLAASLLRQVSAHAHASVLGDSYGQGNWFGVTEHCGSIVVQGLDECQAVRVGASAAARFGQDAVGVVHNASGRTLATPGSATLSTAGEVWA